MTSDERFGQFKPGEQKPPPPKKVANDVVERFDGILEVDPSLMTKFQQQRMPAWDTKRIGAARWDHLDAIHREFADEVLPAGDGPDSGPTNS